MLQEEKYGPNPYEISGLGGWLILIQLGLIGTLFNAVVNLITFTLPSLFSDTWTLFTTKGSYLYHALWGPFFIFEAVYTVLLIGFSIYVLVVFYSKKKILPRLMIILYAGSLAYAIIDYSLVQQIPIAGEIVNGNPLRNLVRPTLTCLFFIPYFLKSVRVKNTFIK